MVTRVWGKCDSVDIIFSYNSVSGLWETAIPKDADGEYIVEIYAEDEAGNTSFFAKMLFTVSVRGLCLSARIVEIGADYTLKDVEALFKMPKYQTEIRANEVDINARLQTYDTDIVRWELLSARINEIEADYTTSNVEVKCDMPKYHTNVWSNGIDVNARLQTYNAEVVRCELCERW